jgi:O-acetyl-ADP-ribose deacetylase (regulator of RNase III)
MTITYKTGDATRPEGDGATVIVHIVNSVGGWGQGFVRALSARWPEPERAYRQWYRLRKDPDGEDRFSLGGVQFVEVGKKLWVANMIAQSGYGPSATRIRAPNPDHRPPIRYDSLEKCLLKVASFAEKNAASMHMPRIGCGLAGGTWAQVEPLVTQASEKHKVHVFVYDQP